VISNRYEEKNLYLWEIIVTTISNPGENI